MFILYYYVDILFILKFDLNFYYINSLKLYFINILKLNTELILYTLKIFVLTVILIKYYIR